MRPCTRRIVPAEKIIKATSLDDLLVEHAPWCRTAPDALLLHTKPLADGECGRRESNPHGRSRRFLRPVRIPVPPHPQGGSRRRVPGGRLPSCSLLTRPVVDATARAVPARGAPCDGSRAGSPW